MTRSKQIALSGVLAALALALSLLENLVPLGLLIPLPGVKLGGSPTLLHWWRCMLWGPLLPSAYCCAALPGPSILPQAISPPSPCLLPARCALFLPCGSVLACPAVFPSMASA